jgi:beta-lactam-binding protein with PASTA domain/serine/threonine protein kinase
MSDDRPADQIDPAPPVPAAATPRRRGLDGRTIGGRYRVLRTAAAGANTLIADAHDIELDRTVTIKLIRPELSESEEFRRSFRKQMEQMETLSHPNMAAVYDWGEERIGKRGTVYLVVEYLSGGSLRDLFDRGRHLTPSQALMVGLEACRGLDFAHRKGLVHTELTPSKLVFGDDRRLRIVDFGLARILGAHDWKEPSQVATHVARYASPEQAKRQPLDGKTDVYSLALIIVEAVTGKVPFGGDSTVATLSARLGKLMPVSADLGPLASLLERAGRPEAGERFSASQFGRALVRAAEKLPRPAPIPIVGAGLFEDTSGMRRPDDPTGGIARPPAAPGPALVPPSPTPVSPTDSTAEIAEPAVTGSNATDTPQPRSTAQTPLAAPPVAVTPGAPADTPAKAIDNLMETPPAPPGEPLPEAPAKAEDGAAFDDLADLVERTPAKPTPPREREPVKARQGPKLEQPAAAGRLTRKARRARKKEAKARLKEAKAREKAAASGPRGAPPQPLPAAPEPAAPPKRRRWVPWFAAIFLLAVLGGLGYLAWVLFRTPTHEVPDVVGLDRAAALDLVDDFEWEINVNEGRSDEFRSPGQIIETSPSAGDDLAEGSPLLLVVSAGPEYRTFPSLSGVPVADAEAELEDLELVPLAPTTDFSETVPEGVVIEASIEGVPVGGDVLPGAEVNLVVSDGPQPRRVPQLRGLTVEQATQLLDDLGLVLSIGEEEVFDNDVPAGEIAVQRPAVDTTLDRGATINAQVSKGPDLVTMPDLSGMNLEEIREALADAGLQVGTLLGARTGTFYAASVDGVPYGGGDQLVRGTAVDIIILVQ